MKVGLELTRFCGHKRRQIGLELSRAHIPQCRVHSSAIIKHLDVLKQLGPSVFSCFETSIVLQFGFEGFEEALDHGVVPTVASAAHTETDAILL